MKRLALILLIAANAYAAVPNERCSARADITGLPLVILGAKVPSDRFAVMITGDGGWRRIDQKITDRLRAAGIPIVSGIREGLGAIDKLACWGAWRRNTSN